MRRSLSAGASLFLFLSPVVCALSADAQDAATQAMIMSQQATQAAVQASQQASEAAMQANQQANMDAMRATQDACCATTPGAVLAPSFSVKAGSYPGATTVRLHDRTRGAAIYYTTDGWTPTTASARYTGPITITSTTTLQAVAVAPNNSRSRIAKAEYKLPAVAGAGPMPVAISTGSNLMHGVSLPLVFTAPVTSHGLEVGDMLPVALAQDVVANGVTIAAKGTPVAATVTQVDNRGLAGAPGVLRFEVHSITIQGHTVPLAGAETMEGQSKAGKSFALSAALLFAAPAGVFVRGGDAEIPQGATLTATVVSDTPLHIAN